VEPAVAAVEDAICSAVAAFRALPAEVRGLAPGPEWGPRENFVHLVPWHEQYASIAEALAFGRAPELIHGTFKAHNARFVEANRGLPNAVLIERLEAAQERLAAAARHADAAGWLMSFRAGSKPWPFPEALRLIAGHVRLHTGRMLKPARRSGGRAR
jgi:hypothetical protein